MYYHINKTEIDEKIKIKCYCLIWPCLLPVPPFDLISMEKFNLIIIIEKKMLIIIIIMPRYPQLINSLFF